MTVRPLNGSLLKEDVRFEINWPFSDDLGQVKCPVFNNPFFALWAYFHHILAETCKL